MEQGCDRLIVVMTHPRNYVRRDEKLMPLIRKTYREYPNFVAAMESRARRYNEDRERIFELECQGKLMVIAPESTMGVSRTERDPDKLRLLWGHGYQAAVDRLEEIREFFGC